MTPATILTSGAPLPWEAYYGGQRRAVRHAAVYEELAADVDEADAGLRAGRIRLGATHDHGCVGSVAGIHTASMPVLVVESARYGNRGFCNLYEGESRKRLNYGVYDDEVRRGLDYLAGSLGPLLGAALRRGGGIPLVPVIRRALHMGDELHSRNTAATLLFTRELFGTLLELAGDGWDDEVGEALAFLRGADYFFLRCSMAAAKVLADAAAGVAASSLVTAMTISCREYAIRVAGCGDRWFRGPLPTVEAKLFEGFTADDIEWIGGESHITETVGLGGFAQAAAFGLQAYQGGGPEAMIAANLAMYDITHGEHPHFKIPYLGFRGTPTGIDVHKVVATGVVPVIDGGLAGKDSGQIGAGILKAPLAEVAGGERLVVETADSLCGLAKARLGRRRTSAGLHIDEVLGELGGACPVTGPFHLAGARPGGVVEIELHRVDPLPAAGDAWTGIFGGFGALQHEGASLQPPLGAELRRVPYRDGAAALPVGGGRSVALELRPFLGTVGVAPRRERRLSFSQSPEYLGDVDQPAARAGATLRLPVHVEGALVAFGDAHGAQGDGEITGVAVEIEAEVELTMRARDREEAGFVALPQLDTATAIGSLAGLQGAELTACARAAYTDLVERLHRGHGFSGTDAYHLLGQVGRLHVGNMIDPFYSVLATVERRYLEPS